MAYRIVCVSRAVGAGGEPIGRAIAERLGYQYVDEEVITTAAERAKLTAEELAATERKPTVMARVMDSIGVSPEARVMGGLVREPLTFDYYSRGPKHETPADRRALIRQAIHDIAERGDVVIVAHAASMALAERNDVLRVLVTASPEVRATRIGTANAAEAKASIAKDDEGRRDYLKRFYGIERELPTHYDLVLNTDRLGPEDAVSAVLALAKGS